MNAPLLEVKNLKKYFPIRGGVWRRTVARVHAVDDVSFHIHAGETLGLVGESGCGKSVAVRSMMRIIQEPGRVEEGKVVVFFDPEDRRRGIDLLQQSEAYMEGLRGDRISMIFQDPLTSLDPLYTIGDQFLETLRTHEKGIKKNMALERAADMLKNLGISPDRLHEYPHQMSGGMRQRIMIGIGLILDPDLLIADEPTTALDVIVEAQFLDLLNDIKIH